MAYLADFVCETAIAPGTATTVTLLGAAPGLPVRTFSASFTNGDRVFYTITDGTSLSESGIGTFHSPNLLSRDTVRSNTSSSIARLNFTGAVFVFCYPPAALTVILDELNKCSLPGALAVTGLADFSLGGAKIAAAASASATAPLRADQAWQTVAKYPMSAVASQTALLPTAFSRFRLILNVTGSASGSVLSLRFSSNGGTTWLTAASYVQAVSTVNSATGTAGSAGGTAATQLNLAVDLRAANEWDATVDIWPGSASSSAIIRGNGFGVSNASGAWTMWSGAGVWAGTAALMNACQIFPFAGGTISGTAIVEGLP